MNKLSKSNFLKAREYLMLNARGLEKAGFKYNFEDGSQIDVLTQIKSYQNSDGGFGNSLEPDFRLEASSPMATSIAFQNFHKYEIDKEETSIKKALNYLVNTLDETNSFWFQVPEEIEQVPRAPWWRFKDFKGSEVPLEDWSNPTIEIIGWLQKYAPDNPLTEELKVIAIQKVLELPDEMEMHDFLCALRFLNQLTGEEYETIKSKLLTSAKILISDKESDWSGYGLRPHWVIKSPNSPLYESFKDTIHKALDFELKNQQASGAWIPFWEWGNDYNEWELASIEWSGILTLDFLQTLGNFNLIEF